MAFSIRSPLCSLLLSLLASTAHGEYSYKRPGYNKARLAGQRKTFCTLLSFNGDSRNPSPQECDQAARKKAMEVCNSLKAQNVTDKADDHRCLTFLKQKAKILEEDCSPTNDLSTPLFVRVACPRFGRHASAFSQYDLIESVPFLDATGANRERWRASVQGEPFSYFVEGFWVYERETRCHGLLASGRVPISDPTCSKYYGYEDDAVCNYLKTIFNDQWDLGCMRLRGAVLGLCHYHCKLRYNVQLGDSQIGYCFTRGRGEDVSCDAVELICNSNQVWEEKDIALPPYFLSDTIIEQIFFFKANEESLIGSASAAESDFPKTTASLDFLQHAIRGWKVGSSQFYEPPEQKNAKFYKGE